MSKNDINNGKLDETTGVPQDYVEAAKQYRKAAEKGYAKAQYYIGVCYADGTGVEQSLDYASKWWHLAAKQGDADARRALGYSYDAPSVNYDEDEAIKWYLLANDADHNKKKPNYK